MDASIYEKLIFGLTVALSLLAWGAVSREFVWPRLRNLPLYRASRPLIYFHLFRFMGASFLIPGVVGTSLPTAFAIPAGYGDLLATLLAWAALLLSGTSWARVSLWSFNLWGTFDLLLAFYQGIFGKDFLPSQLAAAYDVPTMWVPMFLCIHGMLFALLLRNSKSVSVDSETGLR